VSEAKSFSISKEEVYKAYKQVKANRGAAGVDGQSIKDFEEKLKDNLYKIWNRMSSGSYFPPPVKRVEIPKEGGTRPLGIPTVGDRIAQAVVKNRLEPELEKHFHPDSYGYRPGKSAAEAVGVARRRCWKYNWVLDLDIEGFFDNIDHQKLLKALKKHAHDKWILLYVERWLTAPVQLPDGTMQAREKGTPQGGIISPLLANLFLHYAFDVWMKRNHPEVPFERYADDAICHCQTREQAEALKEALEKRMEECGLKLHPGKTKIVYCKDDRRKGNYAEEKFDFLGFTFRPRLSKNKWGEYFVGFNPAVSQKAKRKMNQEMRKWELYRRNANTIEEIAQIINPQLRGWMNYFGSYRSSELEEVKEQVEMHLAKWAKWKYKKLKGRKTRAYQWLRRIRKNEPEMFAHWKMNPQATGL